MNTNVRELAAVKNYAAAQHTAQGRVGRRVAPESASEVLSVRNDGQQRFSAAC